MNEPNKPSPWLIPLGAGLSKKQELFLFPYAGAGASTYKSWDKEFDPDTQLTAIQPPGRENRFKDPRVSSIREYAQFAASAIKARSRSKIYLFGHSLGAIAAFETARVLENEGIKIEGLIVSGRNAPDTPSKRRPISHLSEDDFRQAIKEFGGTPREILENQEFMDLISPLLRADFMLSEHYNFDCDALLTCPITALYSIADPWVDEASIKTWANRTASDFNSFCFDGDHFFINSDKTTVITMLSSRIMKNDQNVLES